MDHDFIEGDRVRLKTGSSHMRVVAIGVENIKARYVSDRRGLREPNWRNAADYVLIKKADTPMASKLYKLLSSGKDVKFGTQLARDSNGNVVLEIKGTGEVVAVKPDQLEEVVPYTIEVRIPGNGANGSPMNLEAEKGAVEVSDVFLLSEFSMALAVVTKLDTKADARGKRLKGMRVATEVFD